MQNLPEETVRFVSASEKLRQHIVNYQKPAKYPYEDRTQDHDLCALERVAVARGTWFTIPAYTYNAAMQRVPSGRFQCHLMEDAVALGFTPDEARGIMNGWDECAGRNKVYSTNGYTRGIDPEALARGEKLGREMYQLSKEKGLV